jgi:NitT/TauT family transport system substrate-binding protein
MQPHRRALVLAGALSALPGVRAQPGSGLRPVVLVTQALHQIKQLPLLLAHRLGYFAAEGLDVGFRSLPPTLRTLAEAADYPADVFAGSFERTLYLNAKGRAEQAFVQISRSPQVVLGTSVRSLPVTAGLKDLYGASVGIQASGSLSHRIAQLVLLRGGVQPSDVNFVELPSVPLALQAFHEGRIEALCYTDPAITRLEKEGLLRVIADTRTLRDSDHIFGGPVVCTCLSASPGYIARYPDVVQGLTNGVVRALKWLQTAGPSDLVRHVPEPSLNGDRALFLEAFNRSRETLAPDGTFPAEGPANVLRALSKLDLPQDWSGVDVNESYTNRFALKARVQYRV